MPRGWRVAAIAPGYAASRDAAAAARVRGGDLPDAPGGGRDPADARAPGADDRGVPRRWPDDQHRPWLPDRVCARRLQRGREPAVAAELGGRPRDRRARAARGDDARDPSGRTLEGAAPGAARTARPTAGGGARGGGGGAEARAVVAADPRARLAPGRLR